MINKRVLVLPFIAQLVHNRLEFLATTTQPQSRSRCMTIM